VQENEEIIREYRERGLLVAVDTGKGTEDRGRSSMTDWRRTLSGRILLERGLRIGKGTARRRGLDRSSRGSCSRRG